MNSFLTQRCRSARVLDGERKVGRIARIKVKRLDGIHPLKFEFSRLNLY